MCDKEGKRRQWNGGRKVLFCGMYSGYTEKEQLKYQVKWLGADNEIKTEQIMKNKKLPNLD